MIGGSRMRPEHILMLVTMVGVGLLACEPMPGAGASASSSGGTSGLPSSGRQSIDAQKLCTRLVDDCKQELAMPACVKSFGALRVTSACIDRLAAATCSELGAASSPVLATCFPPCSGALATCNGDGTITLCTASGATQVADCEASCRADGFTAWTDVCGTAYEGQVADRAQCWCR